MTSSANILMMVEMIDLGFKWEQFKFQGLLQWFPLEDFHEFRGGISTL